MFQKLYPDVIWNLKVLVRAGALDQDLLLFVFDKSNRNTTPQATYVMLDKAQWLECLLTDLQVVGLNPAGCRAFYLLSFLISIKIIKSVCPSLLMM